MDIKKHIITEKDVREGEYWWTGTTTAKFDVKNMSFLREKSVTSVYNPFFLTKNPQYAFKYAKSHITKDAEKYPGCEMLMISVRLSKDHTGLFDVCDVGDWDSIFGNDPMNVYYAEIFSRCEPYFALNSTQLMSKNKLRPAAFLFSRLFILDKNGISFANSGNLTAEETASGDIIPEIRSDNTNNLARILCDENINLNVKLPADASVIKSILDKYDELVFAANIKTDGSGNKVRNANGRYELYRAGEFAGKEGYDRLDPDAVVSPDKKYVHYSKIAKSVKDKIKAGEIEDSGHESRGYLFRNVNAEIIVPDIDDRAELAQFANHVNAYIRLIAKLRAKFYAIRSEAASSDMSGWNFFLKFKSRVFGSATRNANVRARDGKELATYKDGYVAEFQDIF